MPDFDTEVGGSSSTSYASVEQAASHAALRVGADAAAFVELSEIEQQKCLVSATYAIDAACSAFGLRGSKADEDQALEFPRGSATTIPAGVTRATIELAMTYAPLFAKPTALDPLNLPANSIKREKVDVIETEYFAPAADDTFASFPAHVRRLLQPFLISTAATWGSGTAYRAS